jgi:putative Holliday junction resolvase
MVSIYKKRVLAIDYGTKRIGLAKSDPLRLFAQPVGTFDTKGLHLAIADIIRLDGVEKILVGYPLNANDGKNRMTGVVDRFIDELRAVYPELGIEPVDEHRSSAEARQLLVASGVRRNERSRKGRLDSAAAAIILQEYLDLQHR